ncbi:hypothetical protein [Flavobacterium sp. SM2513]|uniref:hypothetical protein n=1 Tax=Flavobacterium sp. SM2513 TaxID=3424766 RepID=UPI003D7FC339
MNKAIHFQKSLFQFGIPIFLIGLLVVLAKAPVFTTNANILSIGITFDLLLTVPFVYFLLIRKTNIPNTTVVPFVIIGVIMGSFILPSENQYYLNLFKIWVLPIIELSVLSFVIYKVQKAIKFHKAHKFESSDFFTTLKISCAEILPKVAVIPVITEIAVFYYGFILWKKRPLKSNEFTYHKESGTISLLVAILFIVAIETVTFHILLSKWSAAIAWVFTILSIYSGIQIFGFLKSMFYRPVLFEDNKLYLRYGIMCETTIDIENIETILISSKDIEIDNETRQLSFLGALESHNVIIRLKEEETLISLYGIRKKFKVLAVHIDNKVEFHKLINSRL